MLDLRAFWLSWMNNTTVTYAYSEKKHTIIRAWTNHRQRHLLMRHCVSKFTSAYSLWKCIKHYSFVLRNRGYEFLLLARYVPNVAKRSIWEQCKKKYILRTDRRPATMATDRRPTDLSFGQYWGNFKWPYLREGSSDPLHVWFYVGVFEVGRSNGANSGLNKCNRNVGEKNARGVIRLVTV